jgi:hypothetical protein
MELSPDSEKILRWIHTISKSRPELGDFSICPFASLSKHTIINCSIDDITPIPGYDVIIFIVEDYWSMEELSSWVDFYNKMYKDYKFFEDSYKNPTYINGVKTNNDDFNLILAQPREKLRKFREKLTKTVYYTYWESEYLEKILENDLYLVKNRKNSG